MPEIAGIGVLATFLAGVVSFLSPCVLPLVPGYLSFVAGSSIEVMEARRFTRQRAAAIGSSLSFVAGFSAVFISLGASATAAGQLLQSYRSQADLIAGGIIVLFGLHMMGALKIGLLNREWRFSGEAVPGGRPLGAFTLGTAFAFGWTPCIGPILGAILAIGASTADIGSGVALLAIYSLGLAVPFLAVAAFTGAFMRRLANLRRAGRILYPVAGAVLTLAGVAVMTGYLSSFGTWLLREVPLFQYLVL